MKKQPIGTLLAALMLITGLSAMTSTAAQANTHNYYMNSSMPKNKPLCGYVHKRFGYPDRVSIRRYGARGAFAGDVVLAKGVRPRTWTLAKDREVGLRISKSRVVLFHSRLTAHWKLTRVGPSEWFDPRSGCERLG